MKEKYFAYALLSLITFITPIVGTIFFVTFLCVCDFSLGIVAAVRTDTFTWDKLTNKFLTCISYLIFIFVGRSIEVFFQNEIPIVKGIAIVLVGIELDSMRKKAFIITGTDVFKFITNFINKKRDGIETDKKNLNG